MKKNCETCRYWNHPPCTKESWGTCVLASGHNGGATFTFSLAYAFAPRIPGDVALITRATFGCVQWEGKA